MRSASSNRKPGGKSCPIPSISVEFCAGNGFRRRSPAARVAHAVSEAVDYESGNRSCRNRSVRSPEATDATAWRAMPVGS